MVSLIFRRRWMRSFHSASHPKETTVTFQDGGQTMTIKTIDEKLSNISAIINSGDTEVTSTISCGKRDYAIGSLGLMVGYTEESKPVTLSTKELENRETVIGRLIDRCLRPLFSDGLFPEIRVKTTVVNSDRIYDPTVMAANVTSIAATMSHIPWDGPVGATRVGRIGAKLIINPTMKELMCSDLDLVYACTKYGTLIAEIGKSRITGKDLQRALGFAHFHADKYIDLQMRLAQKAGRKKEQFKMFVPSNLLIETTRTAAAASIVENYIDKEQSKVERGQARAKIIKKVKGELQEDGYEESLKSLPKAIDMIINEIIRKRIFDQGIRIDRRHIDEVRKLKSNIGTKSQFLGSSSFSRGNTSVSCHVRQLAWGVGPPAKCLNFEYHFFPPSKDKQTLSRREVGHGALIEKALLPVLPSQDVFRYAIHIVSNVIKSEGSTAMAAVCAGSMALIDAGVPLEELVAGVSVGLVTDFDPITKRITRYCILTDVSGLEDFLGDIDFKITGTRSMITASQLGIKLPGIPMEIICECLERAGKALNEILSHMEKEIARKKEANEQKKPLKMVARKR